MRSDGRKRGRHSADWCGGDRALLGADRSVSPVDIRRAPVVQQPQPGSDFGIKRKYGWHVRRRYVCTTEVRSGKRENEIGWPSDVSDMSDK